MNRPEPLIAALILMTSCSHKPATQAAFHDPHSYANAGQVRVRHLGLDLNVLFDQRTVRGTAVLTVDRIDPRARQLVLDSRALQIDNAEISPDGQKYREARFAIGKRDPILGAPLDIDIAPDTKYVRIRYSSSPTASGRHSPMTAGSSFIRFTGRPPSVPTSMHCGRRSFSCWKCLCAATMAYTAG